MDQLLDLLVSIANEKAAYLRKEAELWSKVSQALPLCLKPNNPANGQTSTRHAMSHKNQFDTKEAAQYLGLSEGTLTVWRVRGEGPKFNKMGRRVMYAKDVLDQYIDSRTFEHTTAYGAAKKRSVI